MHVLPPDAACCSHAACVPLLCLDTLSHAMLDCPAVASALQWLGSVYAAVAGTPPPPLGACIMLADEASVWAPVAGMRHIWTHLRIAYLHAVWSLRCRRSIAGVPFSGTDVCRATVAAVAAAIRRDFTRASQDLRRLGGAYSEWFRGRNQALSMDDFEARWAHRGVLCAVLPGPGGQDRLRLSFTVAAPVPVPPLAANEVAVAPAAVPGPELPAEPPPPH